MILYIYEYEKKFFSLLLVGMFFHLPFYAQIRKYIGIVRPEYNSETVSFLKAFQNELKAKGYNAYANYIDGYLKGRFGSGFVYVNSEDKNFVITNQHVIDYGTSASIEFEDPKTGTVTKYENLSIKAIDDEIDIAVLQFKDNEEPFKKGLVFSSDNVEDGIDVYSAGFPGLGNTPLWQLGKGIVTNSSARIKELMNPDISSLIQHSAEVDRGNSGGPLLIPSKTTETGYLVIGVDAGIAVYPSSFCGVGVSYIHFFKDKLNLISFGPTVRIPLNFNKFYINPYGKAEAGFTTQRENTYIPLKLQGGVEVIFNHEDKFKYGFGLSYANLKFKEFGGFDEVDNFVDKDISVVTIYGKFCL